MNMILESIMETVNRLNERVHRKHANTDFIVTVITIRIYKVLISCYLSVPLLSFLDNKNHLDFIMIVKSHMRVKGGRRSH